MSCSISGAGRRLAQKVYGDRMNAAAHILVSGRVQGVGFRFYAEHHAHQVGVRGWAKNHLNGEVEMEVEGTKSAIEEFITLMQQGPRFAAVSRVKVDWREYKHRFDKFEIID
jgi:Acylphosphatases